mgnify:CR=1 FL=1
MNAFMQLAQSYEYETMTDGDAAWMAAVSVVIFGLFLVISVIAYVINAFLLSRIFKKAGEKEWIAWVPIYNSWKLLELGGQQGFWAVLMVIPFVNIISIIFLYLAMYNVGLKLQKDGWFVVLAIFIPILWLGWLAFDSSKWDEKGKLARKTPAPEKTPKSNEAETKE